MKRSERFQKLTYENLGKILGIGKLRTDDKMLR